LTVSAVQTERVRELNRQSIYRTLLNQRRVSRGELARLTGLSVPTVVSILQDFLHHGLVEEVGQTPSRGGRPAQLVQLKRDARTVLSLDLSHGQAYGATINLDGEVHQTYSGLPLRPHSETELFSWIERILGQHPAPPAMLSIAVPGVVDPWNGHVHLAPRLHWDDHPLAEALERRFALPVVLENDVNALTLAELMYGSAVGRKHVLCIALGGGIGAGLVINGELYRGAHSSSGEIGYSLLVTRETAPRAMTLEQPGPLEHYLLELSRQFVAPEGELDLETPRAQDAFGEFVRELGTVLHNLVCLVNPELIIVAWPADPHGRLVQALRAAWQGPLAVEIKTSELGRHGAILGAARLALERMEEEFCTMKRYPNSGVGRDDAIHRAGGGSP
jgi:predicted NBD/HSP70 family sugar kinase